jgi:antitoxin component of MazEF toxin-antitoxin module
MDTLAQPEEDRPTLEELLAKVTAENLHPEVDTGEPVGKETWAQAKNDR